MEGKMLRTPSYEIAKQEAFETKTCYGIGVTDSFFYVGTKEELDKIPVVIKEDYSKC